MNPLEENKNVEIVSDEPGVDDAQSVDDFFRQLEAREKDLHITADTTIIEIAESFDDADLPEFLKEDLIKAHGGGSVPTNGNTPAKPKNDRTEELTSEIAKLQATIKKMEDERSEIFKNSQRRSKDFENFKARAERERRETFQSQMGNLATFLLPALDNFNRAIDSAERLQETKSAGFESFFDGVVIVNHQIYDILAKMGIETIPTVGDPFDPHFHEAVATEERTDMPDGYICEELLRGFRIGDRIVRHSMVKVAKSPQVPVEPEMIEQNSTDTPDSHGEPL